jgi:predicted ATP-grasp superfamily ATP-dependent carboligase
MSLPDRLLLIGASTRAAAWSALRAGVRPICIDLFADEDLRAVAEVIPCPNYPHDILQAARTVPADVPWLYTGALENHPRLIGRLSSTRPLAGISAESVRAVRNPRQLSEAVASAGLNGIRTPMTWSGDAPPPKDGRWMVRSRRSAAGRGIALWDGSQRAERVRREPHSFQQRVEGSPVSALCLAAKNHAYVVGWSKQWIGEAVCGAADYQYCGSLAPIVMRTEAAQEGETLAAALTTRFGLRGLFGCDFLDDGRNLWLTEINPRYTASVETFEFSSGQSLLLPHLAVALGLAMEHSIPVATPANSPCIGKAILYAPHDLHAPTLPLTTFAPKRNSLPQAADIPIPGSLIPSGAPVCTVCAKGATLSECETALRSIVNRWMTLLREASEVELK